jgi:multicomponent Na+:H+ antiporter subunit D
MAAFVLGGLSLIGVPATVGFVSKWYLILAALERDWWWLAFMVAASSLLAVLYMWRVVETAYFKTGSAEGVQEAPLSLLLPTWALIAANVYFGVNATDTVSFAKRAADQLLGVF